MATLSKANLTDEELVTAMVGAKGLLNSHPLTAVRCRSVLQSASLELCCGRE